MASVTHNSDCLRDRMALQVCGQYILQSRLIADGSVLSWLPQVFGTHTFAAPGNYTVTLSMGFASGNGTAATSIGCIVN